MRRAALAMMMICLVLTGCPPASSLVPEQLKPLSGGQQSSATELVPVNPFGDAPAAAPTKVGFTPGSTEAANRVTAVSQKIVSSNRQLGVRPMFLASGFSQPAISHEGTSRIIISEELVKQCGSDGQLAAVLCLELGRMVQEREVQTPQRTDAGKLPPMELRVGTDSNGALGGPNMVRQVELARYEEERRSTANAHPNPERLARDYLARAGYPATDMEPALALLGMKSQHRPTAPAGESRSGEWDWSDWLSW